VGKEKKRKKKDKTQKNKNKWKNRKKKHVGKVTVLSSRFRVFVNKIIIRK
jgi:hypothetical protein